MGIAEWFLGVHFSWRVTSSSVSVHMNQSGFTNNLVESFSLKSRNETPTATPYRSGVPIDSIAPSTDADDSPFKVSLEASVGCCLPHAQPHCGPLLLILIHEQTRLWSHECGPLRLTLHSLDA